MTWWAIKADWRGAITISKPIHFYPITVQSITGRDVINLSSPIGDVSVPLPVMWYKDTACPGWV